MLNHFFKKTGLLFIDAAFSGLRRYESEYFVQLIEQAQGIAERVHGAEAELIAMGYNAPLSAETDAANLFITVKEERILLKREGDEFIGNNGSVRFSRNELLAIAKNNPEILSNNVVTRPLMQEMVFPVLAFVGGPGEIAYWAVFKSAFELMGMEMPVIMPRLGMTLVNRRVQVLFEKYSLTFKDLVVDRKALQLKADLLDSVREKEAEQMVEDLVKKLERDYAEIQTVFTEISKGLTPLVEKNLQFHLKQLNFLKHKLEDEVVLQNSVQFGHYDYLENELIPNGTPQERIYNPIPYLNEYGPDLIDKLLDLELKYDKNHKIIYF